MSGTQEAAATPFGHWLDSVVPALYATDGALAEAVGAERSTVMRWRRGAKPSTKYVLKLAEMTGMDAGALLRIAEYTKED